MMFINRESLRALDDQQLIIIIQSNIKYQEPLVVLLMRYTVDLFRFCMSILKNKEDAEDVVSGLYLKIIKSLLNGTKVDNFKHWVFTIAYHDCLNLIKRRKSIVELPEDKEIPDDQSERELTIMIEEQHQILKECRKKLNKNYDAVIHYFYIEKKCYDEIASILKEDYITIRGWIDRARMSLRKCVNAKNL